ncbi:MAG: hypothetical protein ACFFB0_01780 [Promethearchaeota archaeon]
MVKKSIIVIIPIIIIGFSLIIVAPITILSTNILSYEMINESLIFKYYPKSPTSTEKLNLNVDVGDIKIYYISPPVDYYMKIEVNIDIVGHNLEGDSYTDYFNFLWQNTSSAVNFTLELISDRWFDSSNLIIKNVSIDVLIRKDRIFDITSNIDEGGVVITVPWGISVNNVITNITNGNIIYNFTDCNIEGNITGIINIGNIIYNFNHCTVRGYVTGIVKTGNVEFTTRNVNYTQNCVWTFEVENGDYDLYIDQYKVFGANITGIVKINNGDVFVKYEDNDPKIGAILEIPFGNTFMDKYGLPGCIVSIYNLTCTLIHGFDYGWKNSVNGLYSDGKIPTTVYTGILYLTSKDLIANMVKNLYNITFEIIQGSFESDLTSVPLVLE